MTPDWRDEIHDALALNSPAARRFAAQCEQQNDAPHRDEKDLKRGKLVPTCDLRWNNGVLEQRYEPAAGAPECWIAVPNITGAKM